MITENCFFFGPWPTEGLHSQYFEVLKVNPIVWFFYQLSTESGPFVSLYF